MRCTSLVLMLSVVACGDVEGPSRSYGPGRPAPPGDPKHLDRGLPPDADLDGGAWLDAAWDHHPEVGVRDAAWATPDAAWEPDAAPPDAAWGPDAAPPDAAWEPDATPPDAAPPEPSEDWGPCAVAGTAGRCIPVADCGPQAVATPGFCPGPGHIQCCTPAAPPGPGICDPALHPQPNGGLGEAPGLGGCPPGMAPVDGATCIDRFEGSLVDAAGAPWSPYHNPGQRRLRAVSLAGAVPQGYISADQAEAACAAAGKRLCSDDEWLAACRGAALRSYPYGVARQPGVCNDARARHPAVELFPNDPNPFNRLGDACINQLADGLAATGDHPGCVTPEGVFDLMGNLHEWTRAPGGTFRGGFYVDTVRNGEGCLYRTTAHNRSYWDYSTGFRCCADR